MLLMMKRMFECCLHVVLYFARFVFLTCCVVNHSVLCVDVKPDESQCSDSLPYC
jgi:hypothetical protein